MSLSTGLNRIENEIVRLQDAQTAQTASLVGQLQEVVDNIYDLAPQSALNSLTDQVTVLTTGISK